jgi:hypothetical protein
MLLSVLAWASPAEAQSLRAQIGQGWTFMEAGNLRKAEEGFTAAFETPEGRKSAEVYYGIAAVWWERRNAMAAYMWLSDAEKAAGATYDWDGGPDGEFDQRISARRRYVEKNFTVLKLRTPKRGKPLAPLADPQPVDPLLREFSARIATAVKEGIEAKVAVQWLLLPNGTYWVGDDLLTLGGGELDPARADSWDLVRDGGKDRKTYNQRAVDIASGHSPAKALAAAEIAAGRDAAKAEKARRAKEQAERDEVAAREVERAQEDARRSEQAELERQERVAAARRAREQEVEDDRKAEEARQAKADDARRADAAREARAERERRAEEELRVATAERERREAVEDAQRSEARTEAAREAKAQEEADRAEADRLAAEDARAAERAQAAREERAARESAEAQARSEAQAEEKARREADRAERQDRTSADEAERSAAIEAEQRRRRADAGAQEGSEADQLGARRGYLAGGVGGVGVRRLTEESTVAELHLAAHVEIGLAIPLPVEGLALAIGASYANLPVSACSSMQVRSHIAALHVGPRIGVHIDARTWFALDLGFHVGAGGTWTSSSARQDCAGASLESEPSDIQYGVELEDGPLSGRVSFAQLGWQGYSLALGPQADVGILAAPDGSKVYFGVSFFVRHDQLFALLRGGSDKTYFFRPKDGTGPELGTVALGAVSGTASMARFQFGLRGRMLF